MSEIRTIKVDPGLLQMNVITRWEGAIYMRLPPDLQREITGGCECAYCKAHPDQTPMWDTMAISANNPNRDRDWTWTLHMPDPPKDDRK
jgi:hypothetical protein